MKNKQPRKNCTVGSYWKPPRANVGRNHPDYGLTVAQHLAAKSARQQQGA